MRKTDHGGPQRSFTLDLTELARFVLLTVITAPPNYQWQILLEKVLPAYSAMDGARDAEKGGVGPERLAGEERTTPRLNMRNTLAKWFVDCMTLGAIVNIGAFFVLMGLMKGESFEVIGRNIRTVSTAGRLWLMILWVVGGDT